MLKPDAGRRITEADPPFLETELPHWAARGFTYFLALLFSVALLGAVVVHVPETVSGPFMLVPVNGTDPLRAARRGTLVDVRIAEGESVSAGATLFVIRSEPFGDRWAELRALRAQLEGAGRSASNARVQYESQRRADEEEARRLSGRIVYLTRTAELKRKQLALAREMAERYRAGLDRGAVSGAEYTTPRLEADKLEVELELAESERAETQSLSGKLQHETAARAAQHRETMRALEMGAEEARIRIESLEGELASSATGELTVSARCAGTVLRLRVSAAGAVVQEGDVLGELACAGDQLQGELTVTQAGIARVRAGQSVKLLYEAFPYQRYGVRYGTVRWVGPASSQVDGTEGGAAFRAFIDIDEAPIRVAGQPRALMVGMGGTGSVVVGRRTLVSYALEPIRQLRESFAEPPAAKVSAR